MAAMAARSLWAPLPLPGRLDGWGRSQVRGKHETSKRERMVAAKRALGYAVLSIENGGNTREDYRALLCKTGVDLTPIDDPVSNPFSFSSYYTRRHPTIKPSPMLSDADVTRRLQEMVAIAKQSVMDMEVQDDDNGSVKELLGARKAPLPDEEDSKARAMLRGPASEDIVIYKFSIDMTRSKLLCLRSRVWLNDEVINFYMSMLQERDDMLREKVAPSRLRSHFFNSFFMTKLQERGVYSYPQVRRWTKKFDVFAQDKVFIPINISNTHWTLAVVLVQRKEIHFYDSMAGSGKSYLRDLLRWVEDEHKDKKGASLDVSNWKLVSQESNVPQQRNGVDCGVFAIVCADYLSDSLPLEYSQDDMEAFRVKIAAAIMRGNLSYPLIV